MTAAEVEVRCTTARLLCAQPSMLQLCTAWVNKRLTGAGHPAISNISQDFKNGVNLARLVNSLDARCTVKARASNISMVKKDNIIKCLEAIDKIMRVRHTCSVLSASCSTYPPL